ncbi:hypothetical protein [Caballeronia mineralivorans]|uniref:hypothetical protein n=1 Tax=Caballeronia mineralivorans TaxID=2010198 RepID=UPI0023F107DF|nr:hypothetical protein [Caballeronia mineralivorans]MDB5780994.1 hypothetical protein [Caballeronia mineralivorans]
MDMDLERVKAALAASLSNKPRGTTADIAEHTAIYWDGERPVGVHLCADYPGFDGGFEIDHHFYGDAHEHLGDWLAYPRFSSRPDLVAWLDDSTNEPRRGD